MPRVLIAAALLALSVASAFAQGVQGDVVRAGFPVLGPSSSAIREGQWFPILVELTAEGAHFQGKLRVETQDLDGDRVSYIEEPVTVTAGAGIKRVWCYAVAFGRRFGVGSGLNDTLAVDVLDENGALVTSLEVRSPEIIENDTMLVLDISRLSVPLARLQNLGMVQTADLVLETRAYRKVSVARMGVDQLPDRWWGLEAVDVIVWDQPDPSPSGIGPAQLEALMQWVRNGGRLVIGTGAAWQAIQTSPLADLLPYKAGGTVATTSTLARFFARFSETQRTSFDNPIPVITARARAGATTTFRDRTESGQTVDLIVRRNVGSGRVIAVATGLADLARRASDEFYFELFDVNVKSMVFAANEQKQMFEFSKTAIYDNLVRPTTFQEKGSAFVLAALVFVIAYGLLATLVTWGWLKRKKRTHLSWTVFAAFAVAASLLSVGAVSLKSVFGSVRVVSLIDLEAGRRDGRAACWFGYRSPRPQQPDLSLPGPGNYLRPMARPLEVSTYATPERYTAVTGKATLENAPMRATLKQFEGFWQGDVGGTVRGRITVSRRDGKVTANSWIRNELPVDIVGGYLLYIDPRLAGNTSRRVAGRIRNPRPKYVAIGDVPPAINILSLQIPAMGSGQRLDDFGRVLYEKLAQQLAEHIRTNGKPQVTPELPTLWDAQGTWMGRSSAYEFLFGARVDPSWGAALMLSTRNFYNPSRPLFEQLAQPLTTYGLVGRDVLHWLVGGNAAPQGVLLLLARDGGPAKLHYNSEPMDADAEMSRSVYRVRIPIRYQ